MAARLCRHSRASGQPRRRYAALIVVLLRPCCEGFARNAARRHIQHRSRRSMADAMAERTSPASLRSQPDYEASPTYLTSALPPREGQRPRTESCLPHAQMEAESPDAIFEALTAAASASLGDGVVQGPTTVSVPSTWPAYHLCRPCGAAMPPEACMTCLLYTSPSPRD